MFTTLVSLLLCQCYQNYHPSIQLSLVRIFRRHIELTEFPQKQF